LEVIAPAVVGVIQTSFERDHNSDAGIEGFERVRAKLPWLEFRYYDEHTVDEFYRRVRNMEFSAIVYASNSLWNPAIFESSRAAGALIVKASGHGMGIVVLQQFLPHDVVRECDFLPLAHQVTYRGVAAQIEAVNVDSRALHVDSQESIKLRTDQFGDRSPMLWCEIKPLYPREWRTIATVSLKDREVDVMFRSRTPRGRTIITALPLDWLSDPALLAHVVSRAVRGRGTLYLHPEGENETEDASVQVALGRAVLNGGFLARHVIPAPDEVKASRVPFRHFSHFLVSRTWTWSGLGSLLGHDTRSRLENGGSITAYAREPENSGNPDGRHPLLVMVGGRPAYLQVADRFASWFEVHQEKFRDAQSAPNRALAAVADAIMTAAADPDAIPQVMTIDQVRNLLQSYIAARCGNLDNVDGHVLPTAAVASTMELLGYDPAEVAPLRSWIERGEYVSSPASVRQAMLWLPDLRPLPLEDPSTEIDKVYQALLTARTAGHDSDCVSFLCGVLRDPGQSISVRAIVAEALSKNRDYLTLAKVASSALTLQGDLELSLTAEHPPLETVCLITAALIRIHAFGGVSCGIPALDHDDTTSVQPEHYSDLRRELELSHQQLTDARGQLAATRKFASRVVGTSAIVAILAAVGVYSVLLLTVTLDTQSWVEISLACFVGLTVVLAYVGIRASIVSCEPRWMSAVRDLLRGR
jgi:hypothetical protein